MKETFFECCELSTDTPKSVHSDYHLMENIEDTSQFSNDGKTVSTDRLENMFEEQKSFELTFCDPDNDSFDRKIEHTRELVLYLHKELSEVLDTLSWKLHRKQEYRMDRAHYVEELVDCQKYLLNLCIIWKVSPEEFMQSFMEKSKVVKERYKNEKII
jgi:isopropylmalate/homocitrate/citramalate synthase